MKLKLLTLLLACGLFAFAANVNATDKKEIDTENVSDPKVKAALEHVKKNVGSAGALDLACQALGMMGAPCSPCTNLTQVAACVAKDSKFSVPIGVFCDKTCGKYTCYSSDVAKICQAVCCEWDANHSEVAACMGTSGLKCTPPTPPTK